LLLALEEHCVRQRLAALASAAALALLSGGATGSAAGNPPGAPTGTPAQQQALARYSAYAGPPIDQFTWLGRFYGWEALGKDQLVVFTTPNDAYLLKVWATCDLRFIINLVGLSSTAGTVSAHGDFVTVNSPATGHMRCPIEEIRKIDYRRMQAELRQQARHNATAPQGTPAPAGKPAQ
jgi:hypothetical protein